MINRLIILLILSYFLIGQDIIGEGLYEEELIDFLRSNYKTSTTLGYTAARDSLYLRVDRIDNMVKGVYTNYAVELPATGVDPSTYLYENGINCEHVCSSHVFCDESGKRIGKAVSLLVGQISLEVLHLQGEW